MARGLRQLSALTAGLVLVLSPMAAAAQPLPADDGGITVTLPAGVKLPPGSYNAVVRTPNGEVSAKVVVPTAGAGQSGQSGSSGASGRPRQSAPSAQQSKGPRPGRPGQSGPPGQAAPAGNGGTTLLIIALLALLVLGVGGALLYFKVLVPRRHARSYGEVLAIVDAGDYARALPILTKMEAGLTGSKRDDARFFIAFCLFQLDHLDEAEHRLAALNRENPRDANVAYLLAYLRVARRDYDGAEPVLEGIDPAGRAGADVPEHTGQLYGIVKFQRGMEAFRDGRVNAAAELFEKAQEFGDFGDQIPPDLRNQHIMIGTQCLFDRNVTEARRQFENLMQAAGRLEDAKERESMLASAGLGLALVAWIENTDDSPAEVERLLVAAARRLDETGPIELTWPADPPDAGGLAEELEALREDKTTRSKDRAELDHLLRDIHFLRGAAVLRVWARSDQAEQQRDRFFADVLSRLACAHDRDPDFSDAYLVVGLLRYYLADTDADRDRGAELLRQAQNFGARDPEVRQILVHHDRRRRANQDAVSAYLEVLNEYINDGTVREQVRAALVERMYQYGKRLHWDSRPEPALVRAVPPTVAEMNDRSALLMERVRQLMAVGSGSTDLTTATELTHSLEQDSRVLSERARAVEEKEAELLVLIGDRLLADGER